MIVGMQTEAAADGGYRELIHRAAIVPSDGLSLLIVEGADRLTWLYGQTTQDVAHLKPGEVREACVCSPTGHILAVLSIAELSGSCALILPRPCEAVILDLVERTVFMEEVAIAKPPPEWTPIVVQGPRSELALRDAGIEPLELPDDAGLAIPFRGAGDGFLLWTFADHPGAKKVESALITANPEAVAAARIETGIPDWSLDLSRKVLPPEMGPDFVRRCVSFQKGCYTGQEVLMRIHARGHTNRTWVGLIGETAMPSGARVSSAVRANAGVITSSALSPDWGPIAAALLHNDSAVAGMRVSIETESGSVRAEVREFPLRPSA